MRLKTLVTGTLVAIGVAAGAGSASLRAEPDRTPAAAPAAAAADAPRTPAFATLRQVKAAAMPANELDAVKGQHVHFLDAGGGTLHLAGDVKTENNWENLGGTDPAPVAPSYHGLCVAAGYSGPSAGAIAIPGGQFQCPLN